MSKELITVLMGDELRAWLKAEAKRRECSVADVVRDAVLAAKARSDEVTKRPTDPEAGR